MKFRFILLGPDDEPNESPPLRERTGGARSSVSRLGRYQRSGAGMLHIEQLRKGCSKVTAVSNFYARIVGDLIVDDGEEERREFRLEAELAGQTLLVAVSAAGVGRVGGVLKKLGPQASISPGPQH